MKTVVLFAVVLCFAAASAKIYMQESFDAGYEDRWTVSSDWKSESDMGEWKHTAGEWHSSADDKGIQTGNDAKFYGISAPLDEEFDNKDKDLILQYSVKHEQGIDCGGAYLKLLPKDTDQKSFGGDSAYQVMFGPDVCGSTKRVHAIFNYNDENLLTKNEARCETDKLTHVYRLTVKSDNTYDVSIDGDSKKSGSLFDDWDFLEPKEIKDPAVSKPADWVDEKQIPDPEAEKPEGYDDVSEQIPDPDAEMPEDWDEEDDGEWEPPMIDNPEYQGEWVHPMVANPDYKGEWEHPMIANPDFVEDDAVYHRCNPCAYVGFELWQVKSGSIFDDILVTDDVEVADEALTVIKAKMSEEKNMFDSIEAEKKAKIEEERKLAEEEAEDEDDEDDDLSDKLKDEL